MPRTIKNVVEYFPHFCTSDTTVFILEKRFGTDGYTVWYKLQEELGATENHFLDLRDEEHLEYVVSKFGVSPETLTEIFNLLARLNAIDKGLWTNRIVWCKTFVENVASVYKARKRSLPKKPILGKKTGILSIESGISSEEIPQRKGKESIVNITTTEEVENQFSELKQRMVKWLSNFESIKSPERYADTLLDKYPLHIVKRALKDSMTTSPANFSQVADYLLRHELKK